MGTHVSVAALRRQQEWTFATISVGVVLLFTALVLLSGEVSILSFLRLASAYVMITLLIVVSAFICFAGEAMIQARRSTEFRERPLAGIASALGAKWREDFGLSLVWPVAAFLVLMPSFNAFKQRILPDAGFVHDEALADLDRALFGTDPGIWLHEVMGSPGTTFFFDALYHGWFVPATLGVCVVGLSASIRTRAQYMIAYIGVWILLGSVAAYLLPAAGPAFYEALVGPSGAAPFRAVYEQLAATTADGALLTSLQNQQYLLVNLDQPKLVVGGGISAIPSVHNALAVLFALASFRVHWVCGVVMSGFAFLIWVGSVYLNWHYAVDGIVGGIGAAALWYAAGLLTDRILAAKPKVSAAGAAGEIAVVQTI